MHGYLSDKSIFNNQYDYFSKYFKVYSLDFVGFGENKKMPYPYSLEDYFNQVKEFLNKNGLVKPNIIAHSFGCRVALYGSAREDVFGKLVLTGAAGCKPKRSFKYFLNKLKFNFLKNFVSKDNLTKYYSNDYNSLDAVLKESFKKIVNTHLDKELNKIKNPTLLVFGKNDKTTPLYMCKKLHKNIKNSKVVLIKGAGHFAFLDDVNKFNEEVKEFLL